MLYYTRVPSSSGDELVEYHAHHLRDSPDYLCVLLVRQEDITRCVPRLVIQDTPALERLLVVDQEGPTRINVISAPKLTVVGYSSDKYSELVIGSTPVQVQQPPSTSPSTN